MRTFIRWILFITLLIFGLFYLNSAVFSYWVSFGPPTDYPKAWVQRSLFHFGYGAGLIILSVIEFIALQQNRKAKKLKTIIVLVVIALIVVLAPYGRKFILIDSCLDSGGRWNSDLFQCEK